MTFAFWVQERPDSTQSFLSCRVNGSGFIVYRGVYADTATQCVGSYHHMPGIPGDCSPYAFCRDGRWHHFVLRYEGGNNIELWRDGALGSRTSAEETGSQLFDFAIDLAIGRVQGAVPLEGALAFDELRVWDQALDDASILRAACAM